MTQYDVNFFRPIIQGTYHTLKVQCGLDIKYSKSYIRGSRRESHFEIAAINKVNSNAFIGTITLCFPKNTFLAILAAMIGEQYTEIAPELQDAAAELVSIIIGQAEATIKQQGYKITKSMPTVIRGAAIASRPILPSTVVLPFNSKLGEFHLEIVIDPSASNF